MTALAERVLVFLDIDGVLLPFDCKEKSSCGGLFPDRTLAALSAILEAIPSSTQSASIVLSSTWRVQESFRRQILDSFHLYGYQYGGSLAEVRDFFDITDPDMHSERQHEIYRWLSTHEKPVAAWIALDDEELLEGTVNERLKGYFEGHVVQCDSHEGLTDANAQTAIALIRQQLQKVESKS